MVPIQQDGRYRNPLRNKISFRQKCLNLLEPLIHTQIAVVLQSRQSRLRIMPTLIKTLLLYERCLTSRYLVPLTRSWTRCSNFRDVVLSGQDEDQFFTAFRMNKEAFDFILNLIKGHTTFARQGKKPQKSVEIQLKVALHRLAHNGTMTSNKYLSRLLDVGTGCVGRYT